MRWSRFLRRSYWDEERSRELEAHLEIETEENIARGMSPEDARHAARRKLGNPVLIREEIYRMNSLGLLEAFWQDLRYGARLLRLNPGFAAVAILSLALGIGANTAIFELLDAVRLRALPIERPQELAEVRIADMTGARGNFERYPALTHPLWEQIRSRQQALSGSFAWSDDSFNIAPAGEIRPVRGLWVSGNLFDVLGVRPILGRVFTPADDTRGCGFPGAVISYAFWQREFGGDPSVIGRKLTLNTRPVEVIGATPPAFFGLEVGRTFDVALPICSEAALRGNGSRLDAGTTWWLTVMGRLGRGWSLERATADFNSISPGIFEATLPPRYPAVSVKSYLGFKLAALAAGSGISGLRERYSDPLLLLLALAGVVLVIACANLANLMLARASAREREIAVRLAIGASRRRLIRQLMAESLLVAAVGAGMGLLLARGLSQFLVSLLSTGGSSIFVDLERDWLVLGFTAALAILTCILFGLTPALRATRSSSGDVLRAATRAATASRERFGLRRVLVACQVALSLVLLVGALLFVGSLRNLMTLQVGFEADGILITSVSFARLNLPLGSIQAFKRELIERLQAIPGVASVADTGLVPLSGNASGNTIWIDGSDSRQGKDIYRSRIGAGYFKTLGTPLLAGRDFDERDTATSPKVAIVNEAFARQFSSGANPVGKRFWIEATPYDPETAYEIVGLVKNTKYRSLREDFSPIAFLALSQDPRPSPGGQILIRSTEPLDVLVSSVKRKLLEINPEIRFSFQVLKTQIRDGLVRERLMATLSGLFGSLAALLTIIGLYGMISYTVARRTNEIGIRMALGADRRKIVRMILGEAGALLALGLAAGSALALAAARTARALLFGLEPHDPATLLAAAVVLAAVALGASYLPARRAARLDPMAALRDE